MAAPRSTASPGGTDDVESVGQPVGRRDVGTQAAVVDDDDPAGRRRGVLRQRAEEAGQ